MFRNYIKSAFRNILKNKFYSLLNILGLAVGLVTFIFLFLYISDELSYDAHHEKADRIYRMESDFTIAGKNEQFAIVPIPMGHALNIEYPEVENFVRFNSEGRTLFRFEEKEYYEEDFYMVDSTVFDVFSHKMLMGNPRQSLVEPNSIVVTQSIAEKYFGQGNPMGKILETGDGTTYKVTGVIEDVAENSHLHFDALLSAATLMQRIGEDNFNSLEPMRFWNIGVYTYLLLNENSDIQSIHDKFPGFYDKYMRPVGEQINASFNLMSTPLRDLHFSGNLASDQPKGNITYIYIFSAVAIFILILAAINYMNMATARSARRAREVGIRKVAGAHRAQLTWQFIGESVMISLMALLIALLLVVILLPDFNNLSGKSFGLSTLTDPVLIIFLLFVSLCIGILSGSYPAFYLSSFRPVRVLKGTLTSMGKKGGGLRKALVVFQFFIAILMIIGTIVVTHQINFLRNKDAGFDKDNMIILELQDTAFRRKAESFKKELLQNPGILSVANSTGIPGNNEWIQVIRVESDTAMIEDAMIINVSDYEFLETYGIQIKEGRNFDRKMGTDAEEAVLVNETAVKTYGWAGDPIGKKIHWGFDANGSGGRVMKVIGVFEDYNFKSLHNKVQPMLMFMHDFPKFYMSVKTTGKNLPQTLEFIHDKWREFDANRPFDYRMLAETWDEMYMEEQKLGIIFRIATLLTIFVALLGLLGLSSYVSEQKTKEIGIRKVLGATVPNILALLYREFLILIAIAFVIAVPVAWWRLDIWLENSFIYHVDIAWWTFIVAGLISLLIGLITISFHSVRAAVSNPVDAIKYE